ncbi:MAG TPA: hypothetical protein VN043_01755 [Rhodanobacter sp.]|nr:hypothetical protein [Rhodanobacter sp.]
MRRGLFLTPRFSCDGGRDPEAASHDVTLARVSGNGRLHFIKGAADCPATHPGCRDKAYLVPGDEVLTGEVRGDVVCAMFPDSHGGHTGWLRRNRLSTMAAQPSLAAWDADWVQGDNHITIRHDHGILRAEGEAYYPMADPPLDQFPGGPNLGTMGGDARPAGDRVIFSDEDCSVVAYLAGSFLVVSDNHQCGGLNVRFDGIYRHK